MSVVRRQGGRGGEVLRLDIPELEDRRRRPLHRRGAGTGGQRDDRRLRAGRAAVRRAQRRPACSSSPRRSRWSSTARRRRRSTATGTRWRRAARVQQCGWLKDRYGLSWQVVPTLLATEMRQTSDPARLNRVMKVVLESVKLDIAKLKARVRVAVVGWPASRCRGAGTALPATARTAASCAAAARSASTGGRSSRTSQRSCASERLLAGRFEELSRRATRPRSGGRGDRTPCRRSPCRSGRAPPAQPCTAPGPRPTRAAGRRAFETAPTPAAVTDRRGTTDSTLRRSASSGFER